jgi:FixJ family two-component response regulator
MRMPGLTGSSVLAELASKSFSTPVIVVTADEDPDTRHQARQTGAVAFFRKPVDGPALLDAIAWAVGNRDQ